QSPSTGAPLWTGAGDRTETAIRNLSPSDLLALSHFAIVRRPLPPRSGDAARHPFRWTMLAVRHSVKDQFHPARNPHLIEDTQQVFLDGVFAESQFLGDSTVGQPVGHERYHLLLARRQQKPPIGIDHTQRGYLR